MTTLSKTDRLAAQIFIALTILFIVFIMIASWTPGYTPMFKQNLALRLKDMLSFKNIHGFHDVRDITTNVLLYIPLGIFLSLAVSWAKPRFLTPWLCLGFAVSLLMETLQTSVGRYPDSVDLLTNTAGFLLGFWMTVAAVKSFGLRPSVLIGFSHQEEPDSSVKSIAAIRFLYIAVYFITSLLPFDISVSFSQIYTKLLANNLGHIRIIFDPLYHFYFWPEHSGKIFLALLGFIPIGFLTAFLDSSRRRLNVLSSVYVCVMLAAISETAKIFVLSQTSDIIMFPLAILGGIIGWGIIKIWFKLQKASQPGSWESGTSQKKLLTVSFLFYILIVCLISWAPYQFEYHPKVIAQKIIHESNLIPFKAHFSVRGIDSALDIVSESGVFIPLGLLMTFCIVQYWPATRRWKMMLCSGLLCGVFAVFIELSQAACVGRYVDVTDIILGVIGGALGSMLLRLFSQNVVSVPH